MKEWKIQTLQECNLPDDVKVAFISSTKNFHGISFTPIMYYGEQKFIGTNYAIICKQITETNPPQESLVLMVINSIPNKEVVGKYNYEITDINHII